MKNLKKSTLIKSENTGYNKADVVEYYSLNNDLQPAEKVIFSKFKNSFKNYKVLDIGIGAGRTTNFFINNVREYYGIDYASEMIEACKKKFPLLNDGKTFLVANAKNLSVFKDEYFDFILFSFNGIDHLNNPDRISALKEISRLLKKNGKFCFSSHNLNYARRLLIPAFSINPFSFARRIKRSFLVALHNPAILTLNEDYRLLKDYSYGAEGKVYYIKPSAQIEQLKHEGFSEIEVYTNKGKYLTSEEEIEKSKESWIYYLCNKI